MATRFNWKKKSLEELLEQIGTEIQEAKKERRSPKKEQRRHASERYLDRLMMAQSSRCFWCGTSFGEWNNPTIDHITPLHRGGGNTIENLVAACSWCNSHRNSLGDPREFLGVDAATRPFLSGVVCNGEATVRKRLGCGPKEEWKQK
jgi:5-methylcytosine-specific restriction endonuclease McrA